MTAIKDLVDLVTQLDTSILERRIREQLLPVKEQVLQVEREQFYLERKHAEAMDKLKSDHAEAMAKRDNEHSEAVLSLKASHANQVAQLHAKIQCLESEIGSQKRSTGPAVINPSVKRRL